MMHLGDSLELMRSWPDGMVSMVLTDPPYGIAYRSNHRARRHAPIANDAAPRVDWLADAYRLLGDGGCVVCFTRWDVLDLFRQEMESVGFAVQNELVWVKNNWGMGNLRSAAANEHESMLFATKGNYTFPGKRPTTVYWCKRVDTDNHPTEKPVGLLVQLVRDYAHGKVLDPFAGSGSTGHAALLLGHEFVGVEIEPRYYEFARRRLEMIQAQPKLLDLPKHMVMRGLAFDGT